MNKIILNEEQKATAFSQDKYTRVIAGAGSGKTQVVAMRIEDLIKNKKIDGDKILCITFSKNGANEMKSRVEKAIGYPVPGLICTTFNALENEIALDNWKKFGYRHRMSVIDDVQDLPMCDELLKRHPIYEWIGPSFTNYTQTNSFYMPSALRIISDIMHEISKISLDKEIDDIDANDFFELPNVKLSGIGSTVIDKIIAMYPEYEKMKKGLDRKFNSPVITFDEQIILAMKVLNDDPNYLDKHYNFSYIIVDEAQDTSEYQIRFLNHLINMKKFKALTIVGDDSQAIYESLMNTSPEYLINLEKYLYHINDDGSKSMLNIKDVVITTNYRCQENIINLANTIISKNKNKIDKDLIAFRKPMDMPTIEGFYRKNDELRRKNSKKKGPLEEGQYDVVARDIKKLIEKGVNPNDIAFIAFSKNELKNIADKLTALDIPSKFGFPENLIENSRVVAMLKFISMTFSKVEEYDMNLLEVANAINDGDILDNSEEVILEKMEYVKNYSNKIYQSNPKDKKELLYNFLDEISHRDEALETFKDKFADMDYEEIYRYCDDFIIFGDNMTFRRSELGDGVMLITAHSSKGLEWKYVFGSLNSFESKEMRCDKVEEMRRLLFVMITRARDQLHLYGMYSAYGSKENRVLNRFVKEVYDALDKSYNPTFNDVK